LAENNGRSDGIAVIGLGRFGSAVAESLVRLGNEVLGIDRDPALVQRYADRITHVVEADSTDAEALTRLGLTQMSRAVVAIGTDVEASVLTVLALSELGVSDIWAKAVNVNHGRILSRTGAHHVVFPEADMGERVAHLVVGRMIDFIEFDDGFAIAKTRAPWSMVDQSLAVSSVLSKYGINIVGVKRPGGEFTLATPETVIRKDDILVVSGQTRLVERFAAQAR
jgi:trk system potassium uptake protein TrkA